MQQLDLEAHHFDPKGTPAVLIEEGLALWDASYSVAKIAPTFLRPGIRMFAYVVNTLHDVFDFW